MSHPYKLHPWHGVSIGPMAPSVVTSYVEITPSDTVKYELDKSSGILKVDRPQLYSNVVPALYGFLPQTYCGDAIAALCIQKTGRANIKGDGDPLDVLILTEHRIVHGDILIQAIPIGGLLMIDKEEADDKIIAVMEKDSMYGQYTDISQLPEGVINRLFHYFLTYKRSVEGIQPVEIPSVYSQADAFDVIRAAQEDYWAAFGNSE